MKKMELKKNATKAAINAFTKVYADDLYTKMQIKTEKNYSFVDLLGNINIKILIKFGDITISLHDWSQNTLKYAYYTYNELDNHKEVLKKFKTDLISLAKSCSKTQCVFSVNVPFEDKIVKE